MKFLILACCTLVLSASADKPSPTYSAPSQQASSASQDSYSAPVASSAPVSGSYSVPSQPAGDSYGSPKAPTQQTDSYGSPKAPAASAAPAPAPGQVGSQGYYYYYYPVQNNGGGHKQTYQSGGPSYGAPSYGGGAYVKDSGFGGLLAGKGLLIAIIIGFGIVLAIAGGSFIVGNGGRSISVEDAIQTAKYYIGDVDQDDLFASVSKGLDFLDNLRDIYA